jgi:hypothetical protein
MPHRAFDADPPASHTFRDGFTHANGLPAVPIVLGVAGHRNLRRTDLPALEASLQAIFTQFRAAYPDTPLVLLSSLAEGADQLAAEVALANGVFVRAPLPFPADVFAVSTSFDTEDGRKKLKDLLANPRVESFVVPLPPTDPGHPIDWLAVATDRKDEANSTRRRQCYANAGGYLVRHCDLLIALWDGHQAERPSGTAEHVLFQLTGRPPAHYPWTATAPLGYRGDRGPVCVIHTPREGAPPGSPPAGTLDVRLPSDIVPRGTSVAFEALTRTDGPWLRFWRRVWGAQGGDALRHQVRRLLGLSDEDTAAKAALEADAELRRFRETCQAVDDFNRHVTEPDVLDPDVDKPLRARLGKAAREAVTLFHGARQHRRWYYRLSTVREAAAWLTGRRKETCDCALVWLFILLGASVALFHFYAHLFTVPDAGQHPVHRPVFYWLFLAAIGAAVGVVCYLWWERLDEQRLDYRALAETLRVRKGWAQAGLPDSVADSYLGQLRNEMSWIHRSLSRVCPPPAEWAEQFRRLSSQEKFRRLRLVRDDWVKGQLRHYRTNQRKEHLFASFFRLAGLALALAGWALIPVSLLVAPPHPAMPPASADEPPAVSTLHPRPWMLIGTGLLAVGAGLCIAFGERRSHEELSKQYERMRIVFEDGLRELERQLARPDLGGAQAVIRKLGHEAITEHAQWLILRRARPLELHF